MAITRIASTVKRTTNPSSSVTTDAINTTGATLLVLCVHYYMLGTPSDPVDSLGNTWTLVDTIDETNTRLKFYYCIAPTSVGTGHQVTVNVASGSTYQQVTFAAYGGESFSYSGQNYNYTHGDTSLATGSVTPTVTPALVVSVLATQSGTASFSVSGGSLAILVGSEAVGGTAVSGHMADEIQTSAAAVSASWSWSGSGTASAAIFHFAAVPTLAPPTLVSGAVTTAPTVAFDQLELPTLASGAAVTAPTIAADQTIEPPSIASGATLYTPFIGLTIQLPTISSGATVTQPTALVEQTISLPKITNTSITPTPTVQLASQPVLLPTVPAGTVVRPPSLGVERSLSMAKVTNAPTLTAPSVTAPAAPGPFSGTALDYWVTGAP